MHLYLLITRLRLLGDVKCAVTKRSYLCNAAVRKLHKRFKQGKKHDNTVFLLASREFNIGKYTSSKDEWLICLNDVLLKRSFLNHTISNQSKSHDVRFCFLIVITTRLKLTFWSLKEAMRVFEDFIDTFMNITTPIKGQLNDGGEETRRESIFKVAVAFEEFALNYGKYHLNGTNPSTSITSQTMGELILFFISN